MELRRGNSAESQLLGSHLDPLNFRCWPIAGILCGARETEGIAARSAASREPGLPLTASLRRPFHFPKRRSACRTCVQLFERLCRLAAVHDRRPSQNAQASWMMFSFSWTSFQ